MRWSWIVLFVAGPVFAQNPLPADHAARMAKGLDLFKKHVRPVLVEKCLRCHGGKDVESEFDLSDREQLIKGGVIGPGIVVGNHKESILYKLVAHLKEPKMPHQRAKLPDADIARIGQWIDLGAPYDTPLVTGKKVIVSWTERALPVEAKAFWSFQPLKNPVPPPVKGAWGKTPIDAFILAELQKNKMRPNDEAPRRQLLRRLAFDLTGLPPSPEEADAFLNDTSPDAYSKMVDRLLSSPHYGERWARHWLDLARFAESHGFEHDYDRPTAYHYRDFVIEALNRDLPYNTFVKWQIAGDEYEPKNNLALKATGFLAAGVHSTQITKSEVEKHRYDELDDKVATLTTTFLGLTLGCARCHDHKYDPLPQRDYYRMLSAFTHTIRTEVELDLEPQAYKLELAAFQKRHEPFEEAVQKFEKEHLLGRFETWERGQKNPLADVPWEQLSLISATSKDGADLKVQPDGSILVSGAAGKNDIYTLKLQTRQTGIRAFRIEALSDPTLPKSGPGRAPNGNFALSDMKVSIAPLSSKDKAMPIALSKARATFEQTGLAVKGVIDGDPKSAWAVDPQIGKDHAASFETQSPVGFEGGSDIGVTLSFKNNTNHGLGRFRISVALDPQASLIAPGISASVREALAVEPKVRSEDQIRALLTWYRTQDPEWRKLDRIRQEHLAKAPKAKMVKALIATEGMKAVRLHSQGEDLLPETHFLRRGDVDQKEGVAAPSYLQVLMPGPDAEKRWQISPPAGWRTSYKRRALAEWMTDVDHGAGSLLARVVVNRLWQHHLGRGIVATPSDFGARGEAPSHPELLDFLARELIQSNWSLKHIHKLIVTSAVYRQAAAVDSVRKKQDPDNKLCWHNPSRRLEAEVIRDNLLAVSGQLDRTPFGPGTLDEGSKRRSIYFTVKRSKLMPMMVIFDSPEALSGMAERPTTTIAPQALHLLNNPQVRSYARSFAQRIAEAKTNEDAVRQAYRIALTRDPDAEELADGVAFVARQTASYPANTGRLSALADFCQVLFCLNEFIYVD